MPRLPPAMGRRASLHLLWIVPLGFALKRYSGPGAWWVRDYAAAVCYELFWILAFFGLIRSRRAVVAVPAGVFAVTCVLELLQASKAAMWRPIRSHFLGQALFGTTFDPWDFPVYLGSCVLGWLYLRSLTRHAPRGDHGDP